MSRSRRKGLAVVGRRAVIWLLSLLCLGLSVACTKVHKGVIRDVFSDAAGTADVLDGASQKHDLVSDGARDISPDVKILKDIASDQHIDSMGTEDTATGDVVMDTGSDSGGGNDIGKDTGGICSDKEPLQPFEIGIQYPSGRGTGDQQISGKAVVSYVGPYNGNYDWDVEIHFDMLADSEQVKVLTKLPNQYQIPVRFGEVITLYASLQMPWWLNTYVAIWDMKGRLRFFLYNGTAYDASNKYDCNGITPCPQVALLETSCLPVDGVCGKEVHPPVEFSGAWGSGKFALKQGETYTELAEEGTFKFLVPRVYQNVTMDCVDYPSTWISAFFVDNFVVSQCRCYDKYDCSVTEACETESHRCMLNKCLTLKCDEGQWCDPYKGECIDPPPSPLYTCKSSEDCPLGDACNYVCNTYLGYCQMNDCCLIDCIMYCSPLLNGCYRCLSDCDCMSPDLRCDSSTHGCVDCRQDKITFTKTNENSFDFYELCIPKEMENYLPALKLIDSMISCGVTGNFAKCNGETETGCQGQLEYVGTTKVITDGKWKQLCRLSLFDFVRVIAGGHYVH
jgi:hypothetical protein